MEFCFSTKKYIYTNLWALCLIVGGAGVAFALATIGNRAFGILPYICAMVTVLITVALCTFVNVRRWKQTEITVKGKNIRYKRVARQGVDILPGSHYEMVIYVYETTNISETRRSMRGVHIYGDMHLQIISQYNQKNASKKYEKLEVFIPAYFNNFSEMVDEIKPVATTFPIKKVN